MPMTNAISELTAITKRMIAGDEEAPYALLKFIDSVESENSGLANLAENISMLTVQKDVKTFRLEQIIEDLLLAHKELDAAKHDPLTDLPNRALFYDILQEKCAANQEAEKVALMFIDLDKFKQVNDTLGHDAGDEVLQIATKRMQGCIRRHDVLCRLGGDEFTVILPHVQDKSSVEAVAARIIADISKPFRLKNGEAQLGASIGISFYPDDTQSHVSLLKNADIAMYKAKEGGRNRYDKY